MLNKPTNVSPYNVFVDVSEGLDLNFTLNNTVDALSIDIYKDDNSIVSGELINNTDFKREFSYTVPEDVLTGITNGNNYYWKTRYWKTPLEENKKGESCLNYWSEKDGVIGLYPSFLPVDFGIYLDEASDIVNTTEGTLTSCRSFDFGERTDFRFTTSWQVSKGFSGTDGLGIRTNKSFLYFDNGKSFAYVPILGMQTDDNYIQFMSESVYISGECFNASTSTIKEINSLFNNAICRCFSFKDISESFEFTAGDYVKLSLHNGFNVCKIQSISQEVYNYVPTIKLSLSSGIDIGLNIPENIGLFQENITASIFSKAEYNESPPYCFSCRETPDIDIYDVSTTTPQIRIRANLKKYIDINLYYYQVYHLEDNNKWSLLWQSGKMSTVNSLSNDTFDTETIIYNGITPQNTYKIKLIGQTTEGQDFEVEKVFSSEDFSPITTKDFVSFNRELGCIEIDNSVFTASMSTYELQIYRHNVLKDELDYIFTSSYDFNTTTEDDGYCKRTITYDFNIVSDVEYIYYAYLMDENVIMRSYVSEPITPSWDGVYLTDATYENSMCYVPDLSNIWFLGLNYEPGETTRNYQIAHPLGIGQKYPKSVRGNANFRTGQVSGLLGKVSCASGEYEESLYLIEDFDSFCANGNPKLLRSSVKGEQLIADIDSMSSSEFAQGVTSVTLSYTQIDDITRKQISVEV